MINKKSNVSFVFYSLIFIVLFIYVVFLVVKSSNVRWDDKNTWDTNKTLSFPQENPQLRLTKTISSSNSGEDFLFHTDYCNLFAIDQSTADKSLTLRCSLLPMYYPGQAQNTSSSTKINSDILLKIHENDPVPLAFLGKSDKSFSSIRVPETKDIPVSITVKGRITKPERNSLSLMRHFFTSIIGKNSQMIVEITEYSVNRLDTVTFAEKEKYALSWAKAVNAILQKEFTEQLSAKTEPNQKLNYFRQYFSPTLVHCSKLSSCIPAYEENPSEKVAYYMYSLGQKNTTAFSDYTKLFKALLYPFNGKYPPEPSKTILTTGTDWTLFSPYNFPICPIAEVISDRKNTGITNLFNSYAKNLDQYGDSEANNMKALSSFNNSLWIEAEGWNADFIQQVDGICGNILQAKQKSSATLRNSLIDVYFNMLSAQIGTKISYTKESIADTIYTKSAFSPYSSPLLIDSVLMKDRAKGVETFEDQRQNLEEWKSLLHTLILIYLYESL